jgi:hypothetical protein
MRQPNNASYRGAPQRRGGANPESITPIGDYGFRLSPLMRLGRNDEPGESF